MEMRTWLLCMAAGGAITACRPVSPPAAPSGRPIATVPEIFSTPRDTSDNIDSPAVWHGPNGEHWLLTTAKTGDVLVVSDATTGVPLRRVGGSGRAPGQMERPNGIAVVDDLALVVERDNARVQVFRLPDFAPHGIFGAGDLVLPYGIATVRTAPGRYTAWVTDNYEREDEGIPPDSLLGRRVREYRISPVAGDARAVLTRTFGATRGAGVLRVVESIAVDAVHRRLLIAEEHPGESALRIYSLGGRFTGRSIPSAFFPSQAEGIALYACGGGDGYWITTDQSHQANTFHIFDRRSFRHLGSFRSDAVRNTDGIALTQAGFGRFPSGAFYAVHDDGNVAAISWSDIADALGLRKDCPAPR